MCIFVCMCIFVDICVCVCRDSFLSVSLTLSSHIWNLTVRSYSSILYPLAFLEQSPHPLDCLVEFLEFQLRAEGWGGYLDGSFNQQGARKEPFCPAMAMGMSGPQMPLLAEFTYLLPQCSDL